MASRSILHRYVLGGLCALVLSTPTLASEKTAYTLAGAGLGAVAGSVISDGDVLVTLGSAAAGGLLGNALTPERQRHYHKGRHKHVHKHKHYGPPRHHYVKHHRGKAYGKHHKRHKRHKRHRH